MCHHAPVVAGVPPSHRDIGTVGADKSRVPCGEKGMPCKSGGGGGAGAGIKEGRPASYRDWGE